MDLTNGLQHRKVKEKSSYTRRLPEKDACKSMKKLGVAVIGTGQWGKNHARVYKELQSSELIAVCDVNSERAKAMANQYGVKAYSDSKEMLKDKNIEAVNICTWSTILAQEALKALNAGKHVLVEKPMATNPDKPRNLYKQQRKTDST